MAHLQVRVTAGARDTAVIGWQLDTLLIRVREPAEKGRANEAVIQLLAKSLGVTTASLTLKRGATARVKLFEIDGLGEDEIKQRLNAPVY